MRLKHRIALTFFALQTALVLAVTGTLHDLTERRFVEAMTVTESVHLGHLAHLSRAALLTEDYAELQISLEETLREPSIEAVVVLDVFDRVVASTVPALIGGGFEGFGDTRPEGHTRRRQVAGYGQTLGLVQVRFTNAPIAAALHDALARTLLVAAVIIVASALVALALGQWLAARLGALSRASAAVAAGHPLALPPLAGASPEVRQLAQALQTMVARLEAHAGELQRAHDRLIVPTEAMAQGFALWDRDDHLRLCNGRMAELLGVPATGLLVGLAFDDYAALVAGSCADEGEEAHLRRRRDEARRGGPVSFELTLTTGRTVRIDESVMRDGGVVAIWTDVTERYRHAAELARNERRLELIMSCVLDGLLVVDRHGRVLHANPAAMRMLRGGDAALGDLHLPQILRTEPSWRDMLARRGAGRLLAEGELDGAAAPPLPVEVALVQAGDDEPDLFILGLRDIRQRKLVETELRFAATHDRLTGLANHSEVQARLQTAIARAETEAGRLALLFVDLDGFKLVNDTLGHVAGDVLLAEVARRLRGTAGDDLFVGRLGGDEFGILVEGDAAGIRPAAELATSLLAALRRSFRIGARDVEVGASIGIALFPDHARDATDLLRAADAALYRAKRGGGHRWCIFRRHEVVRARHRVAVAQRIERGLADGEFHLAYQPQYALASGRLVGFEALARWTSGVFGVVPPDAFIPVAEETGRIGPLGYWILDRAVEDLGRLRDAAVEPLRVAVNVSPRQLDDPSFSRAVLDLVGERAGEIAIELTERVFIDGSGGTRRHLDALTDAGLPLVLDDFGTGFSSLNHLRHFRISEVKIDRSFIADVLDDPNDAQIVRAVIALCGDLDLVVTAEGVETAAQRDWLLRTGCALGQGYLFARPLPLGEALALAREPAPTSRLDRVAAG